MAENLAAKARRIDMEEWAMKSLQLEKKEISWKIVNGRAAKGRASPST